ncbi:MAG: ankyrin repeat domain-containing protein [Planctomycetota bacterium]|nr:MAG: ankyrin repeat domain-containing protein [Planctomycetota bacterium]
MKITISSRATVFLDDTAVDDRGLLQQLDGCEFLEDRCGDYIDSALADLGIVGGEISYQLTTTGLRIITDYWAPRRLTEAELSALIDNTVGQWSDGIGEGGFDVVVGGRVAQLVADDDDDVVAAQVEDGAPVSKAPSLAMAAREGRLEEVAHLLEQGLNVEQELQGYRPLHLAILYGHADVAILLLESGANAKAVDRDGHSPLLQCVASNALDDAAATTIAECLVANGADAGPQALEIARQRGKTRLAELLAQQP